MREARTRKKNSHHSKLTKKEKKGGKKIKETKSDERNSIFLNPLVSCMMQ